MYNDQYNFNLVYQSKIKLYFSKPRYKVYMLQMREGNVANSLVIEGANYHQCCQNILQRDRFLDKYMFYQCFNKWC